jgi:hypothetical protein
MQPGSGKQAYNYSTLLRTFMMESEKNESEYAFKKLKVVVQFQRTGFMSII